MEGCEIVFSISKFDEYCGIFEEKNFGLSAIKFFRSIGHTLTCKPYLVADDINYCIYFDLGFNHIFMSQELESFSYIKQLSLLFELDGDVFDIGTNKTVKYYAIELSVQEANRSQIAHTIHNAFARESVCCNVIIFRNYEQCMISISYSKEQGDNKTYLSDWISINSDVNYIESIIAHNLSFQSTIEFISDFIYYSARKYYIYQISKDYCYSQIYNIEDFRVVNMLDKNEISQFIDDILYYHIKSYGDDYVEVEENDEYLIERIAYNDSDFDLLELELDEILKYNISEEFDEEFDDEVDDFSEIEEIVNQIDISDIDDYILNDPIKLIKWIEDNKSKI